MVERWYLTGKLFLLCAQPTANVRDVRILHQKLQIMCAIFANYVQHFNAFFYGKIVCD